MTHADLVELEKKAHAKPWTIDDGRIWSGKGRLQCVCEMDGPHDAAVNVCTPCINAKFVSELRNAAPAYFAVVEAAKALVEKVKDDDFVNETKEYEALREASAGIGEG